MSQLVTHLHVCESVCVCVCTTPYVGLRSIASVAPARPPSLPQTINSVIATPRLMHRPKQSAKRKRGYRWRQLLP